MNAPRIVTPLPGPKSAECKKRDRACVAPAVGTRLVPVVIKKARGTTLEDIDGNVHIDFAGESAAAGYCHPRLDKSE